MAEYIYDFKEPLSKMDGAEGEDRETQIGFVLMEKGKKNEIN